MIEKDSHLPANIVTADDITVKEARRYGVIDYRKKRFYRRYRTRRLDRFEKRFAQRLFDMVGSSAHIVDIPCGNGRFFKIFSKANKLTMIDYSINMLKVAEEKSAGLHHVRLIQADIASIPLSDNSADLCFCMRLFQHMKNDPARLSALKELARISRKYVALSFYNKHCLRYYRRQILGKTNRKTYITFTHMLDLAKQAGLEFVQRSPGLNLIEQQCLLIFKKA